MADGLKGNKESCNVSSLTALRRLLVSAVVLVD